MYYMDASASLNKKYFHCTLNRIHAFASIYSSGDEEMKFYLNA